MLLLTGEIALRVNFQHAQCDKNMIRRILLLDFSPLVMLIPDLFCAWYQYCKKVPYTEVLTEV